MRNQGNKVLDHKKFSFLILISTAIILWALFSSCLGYTKWERDVEMNGIEFKKIRYSDSGGIIAYLDKNTTIQGYPCKKGWVHFHENKDLKSFALEKSIKINYLEIPVGTWMTLNQDGLLSLCAFPDNIDIQGYLCRGTGGPKGVQVSFYESGALRVFFSPDPIEIQGIPCKGGVFNSIVLHENGDLKECTLSEPTEINYIEYDKGERLSFDIKGNIFAKK